MSLPELRMTFSDLAALEREIATNLKHGRAFLLDAADVQVLSDCVLVLVHPAHGAELHLSAYVVMVSADGPMKGTGLEMRPWGAAQLAEVEAFAHAPAPVTATTEPASAPAAAPDAQDTQQAPAAADAQAAAAEQSAEADDDPLTDEPQDAGEDEGNEALDPETERELTDGKSMPPDVQLENKHDKLRHLSVNDQLKIARTGELGDRLVVERLYGKQVWEALLHNPRLTIPEVARIARKGTVPKPLLEVILDNSAWIKTPQVRRALLGNPKCGAEAIGKLLRVTPKHELKQIEKGTAYAMPVREAARKLLKQLDR